MAKTLSEAIAEGRRLIGEAAYNSAEPWRFERDESADEIYFSEGTFDVIGSGLMANAAYPENETRARLAVLAVNALPALLDVAEAAAAYQEEMAALGNGVDPALSAALAKLALGRDGEGKEKPK